MLKPQFVLPLHTELVVDLFAGGGGASTGIEQAIGRSVDVAINHDPEAISLHQANHPQTRHYCSDVFEVDPLAVTHGQPVGLLWASPDCKHFSKAKGGKPVSKKIRSLAWVVVKWAKAVRPRVIFLENVEEFQTWGPLGEDQKPCPHRKGKTFQQWVESLRNLGYEVEWKELRACDYGAPTIRKRLFLVARRDGLPIEWPAATHGDPKRPETKARRLKPWRTAAECIDWTLPTPSIFERDRPLADATLRRIARGIVKYVIEAQEPFVVSLAHGEESPSGVKRWGSGVRSLRDPLQTVLASGNGAALCVPTLVQCGYGERDGQAPRVPGLENPLGTVVAGASKHALVAAFMTKFNTGSTGFDVDTPMHTITAGGKQARPGTAITQGLVRVFLTEHANASSPRNMPVTEPLRTQCANVKGGHFAAVAALLVKYYGNDRDGVEIDGPMHTIRTRDCFGLVTVQIDGEPYVITDIGMRMLQPHELYAAQGFPADYQITVGGNGRPLTKTAQVRMCGNSVCPPMARMLVAANYAAHERRKAA